MAKFKVGDKVVVKHTDYPFPKFAVGVTLVVGDDGESGAQCYPEGNDPNLFNDEGGCLFFLDNEIELVESSKEKPSRKKRSELVVGDKVKIRKKAEEFVGWVEEMDQYLGKKAFIVLVYENNSDWLFLDVDGGYWIWHRKMLKHIPE